MAVGLQNELDFALSSKRRRLINGKGHPEEWPRPDLGNAVPWSTHPTREPQRRVHCDA
jgi:hypothetical protein